MFLSNRLRPYAARSRRWRLAIRCVLLTGALAIITCKSVEGPQEIIEDPDTTGNDTTVVKDTIPPQVISDAAFFINETTYVVTLNWSAPYDDSFPEPVSAYEIRYSHSYSAIDHWDLGILVSDPPEPAFPGTVQHCTQFSYVERGKNLYAAIKSIDEADNLSARSNIATVHIPGYTLNGICTEAISNYPVGGLEITILAGQIFHLETTAAGTFEKDDLTKDIYLYASTGLAPFPYHTFTQHLRLQGDSTNAVCMIPFKPVASGEYHSLLWLFKTLTRTTSFDLSTILRKWKTVPIKCYIPDFVNSSGVDYAACARRAAERWMNASGWELFTFVDTPPDTGIVFEYRTSGEMGNLRGITEHTDGTDLLPLLDTIALADYLSDSDFLYRVSLHELGHAIRLGHVTTKSYIMYSGQPLPADISADELAVIELLRALPNYLDMNMYDDSAPGE